MKTTKAKTTKAAAPRTPRTPAGFGPLACRAMELALRLDLLSDDVNDVLWAARDAGHIPRQVYVNALDCASLAAAEAWGAAMSIAKSERKSRPRR